MEIKFRGTHLQKWIKEYWPLVAALAVFFLLLTLVLVSALNKNQGHLVYALDDPYIHMAIAKNFSQHGVWGVTPFGFSSASSSILWPLLLTFVFKVFGPNEITPLVLNLFFSTLLIVLAFFLLKKKGIVSWYGFLTLMLMIIITPLPFLVFSGMEHILHILLTISFVFIAGRIFSNPQTPKKHEYVPLYMLTPWLAAARFEGLAPILISVLFLTVKKKVKPAIIITALGLLPILLFGIYSITQSGGFLPNSIVVKLKTPDFTSLQKIIASFGYTSLISLAYFLEIYLLVIYCSLIFIFQHRIQKNHSWDDIRIMTFFFVLISLLHNQYISFSWFFRYEAYLVSLGILIIAISLHHIIKDRIHFKLQKHLIPSYMLAFLIVFLMIIPFRDRAKSLLKTSQATTNIYHQQYQMALFLKKFYQGQTIAANDIGVVTYLPEIKIFDINGLGTKEVADRIAAKTFTTSVIDDMTKKDRVKIAILYDLPYKRFGVFPQSWTKVGTWEITNNVVCSFHCVSFYAIDQNEKNKLIRNLRAFSSQIPADIIQSGEYLDGTGGQNLHFPQN